jgi:hypothetical protein
MAELYEREKLVDGEEVLHAIAELVRHVPGVIGECLDRVSGLPPTFVLKRLRQIPVVEPSI